MICPNINANDVPELIEKYYGLKVKSIKDLRSYDDKNYFIQVYDEIDNPFISKVLSSGYVFKVLNSRDSQFINVVDGQNLLMKFLKKENFNVPIPIQTKEGHFLTTCSLPMDIKNEPNCQKHIIRLLSFIPGKLIVEIDITRDNLYELGVFVGKLITSLQHFSNESIEKHSDSLWTLLSVPELDKYLFAIKDPSQLQLIEEVLLSWKSVIVPILPTLEKGIIHGDLNEQNLLVEPATMEPSVYHISGLLDFGDVNHSYYIFEVAIAITYMIMECKEEDFCDVPGYMLAGYLTQRAFSEDEWIVLKECIACRFAQSLVLGAYSFSLNPTNSYLLTTAKSWGKLEKFWKTPKEDLISKWKIIAHRHLK